MLAGNVAKFLNLLDVLSPINSFLLSSGGVSQVILHEKSQNHQKAVSSQTQSQLKKILPTGHIPHSHGGLEVISPEIQVLEAEIFETLHKTVQSQLF